MGKDDTDRLERDFNNITEYKKKKLVESFTNEDDCFFRGGVSEHFDYRKQKVLERCFDNEKAIEKINNEYFKVKRYTTPEPVIKTNSEITSKVTSNKEITKKYYQKKVATNSSEFSDCNSNNGQRKQYEHNNIYSKPKINRNMN